MKTNEIHLSDLHSQTRIFKVNIVSLYIAYLRNYLNIYSLVILRHFSVIILHRTMDYLKCPSLNVCARAHPCINIITIFVICFYNLRISRQQLLLVILLQVGNADFFFCC